MNNFKKVKSSLDIIDIDYKDALEIKLDDATIKIYDDEVRLKVLNKTFDKTYRMLLSLILDVETGDENGNEIILTIEEEIKKLKLFLRNYGKFLSKEELKKYQKMIMILEEKVPERKKRGR